jgi:hypothetical protein
MTGGSGTKTLNHGDLVAVVFDMTARAGADTLGIVVSATLANARHRPGSNSHNGTSWSTATGGLPRIIITFDDGTLGWFEGSIPYLAQGVLAFADASNPDEQGIEFSVPWDCKISGYLAFVQAADANSDFTLKMYTDATGTPADVSNSSIVVDGATLGQASQNGLGYFPLPAEIALTRNTLYGLTIRASGSSNISLNRFTFNNAAYRAVLPGTTNLGLITRQNDTGAFTKTTTAIPQLGVIISSFDDGTGSGGGGGGAGNPIGLVGAM